MAITLVDMGVPIRHRHHRGYMIEVEECTMSPITQSQIDALEGV